MQQHPESASDSPLPWRLHNTGGYIAIVDAKGKPVLRKTTNTLSIEQYNALRANLEFIVAASNAYAAQRLQAIN